MNFLENQTVQAWIAPIIVTIIITLGGYAINVFRRKRQAEKSINTYSAAEDKLLESLMPFFIQEINLDKRLILDVRKAIVREYGLDEDKFITIDEIRNIVVLNILKTSFIKEEDKKRLAEGVYNIFDSFKLNVEEEGANVESYVSIKEKEIQRYKNKLVYTLSAMVTIGLILWLTLISLEMSGEIELPIGKSGLILLVIFISLLTIFVISLEEVVIEINKKIMYKIKEKESSFNKIND
ncbi:hypothetical protein [Clostridium paraputrificum]|uniref:hypothetical protein n=1 Tax=Clostridium paraputrificum TaxID=29363 RepID=UPI001A9BB351|nr:hypothetical protein [Clostridium paraputrificum]